MDEAVSVHDEIVTRAIEDKSGVIFKTGGDSFCAAFNNPQEAVAAAVNAQRALTKQDWPVSEPIKVRIGLNSGVAHVRGADYFGPTLNRTARLMDVGHGGQLLVAATTSKLLMDDPTQEISFRSLGTHHLRDLYRPEEIFQVEAPGLSSDFPPLRLGIGDGLSLGDQAIAAYEARDWHRALDLLDELSVESILTGREREMRAASLYWLGRHEEVKEEFEAAHHAYRGEGDDRSAAVMAIWLAEMNTASLSDDLARAWEGRAERLLEGDTTSVARGHLLRRLTVRAFDLESNIPKALDLVEQALAIAVDQEDGSLETLVLLDKGRILIAAGDVDDGFEIMDEAMTAAVAGDVNPVVLGKSYCLILGASKKTGDVTRVTAWSEAANRFCDENDGSPFPGVCRVYRAENMWVKGNWAIAESDLMTATSELGIYADVAGEAYYQYGEMRLFAGDDKSAEAAFQEALARGREPIPGYAQLLANRGDVGTGLEMISAALADPRLGKLDRAAFLPAFAELLLHQGRVDKAEEAAEELAEISELAHSDLFSARSLRWNGNIALHRGDPSLAIDKLKESARRSAVLGVPYESALARVDLASAYLASDNPSLASMELNVAQREFERLGAQPDLKRVETIHAAIAAHPV